MKTPPRAESAHPTSPPSASTADDKSQSPVPDNWGYLIDLLARLLVAKWVASPGQPSAAESEF